MQQSGLFITSQCFLVLLQAFNYPVGHWFDFFQIVSNLFFRTICGHAVCQWLHIGLWPERIDKSKHMCHISLGGLGDVASNLYRASRRCSSNVLLSTAPSFEGSAMLMTTCAASWRLSSCFRLSSFSSAMDLICCMHCTSFWSASLNCLSRSSMSSGQRYKRFFVSVSSSSL
jgi:hypothetical protein